MGCDGGRGVRGISIAKLMNLFATTADIFDDVHECRQFEGFVHEPIHTC